MAADVRVAEKSGPVIATSTGVGVPKFMIWLTMSPGSNENWAAGNRLQIGVEGFLENLSSANCGLRLQRDLQHTFVRPTGPQEDRVDWIGRRLDTDISERDFNIVGTGRLLISSSTSVASRSVDSNLVPAGARKRSWNWLTPPAGKISRPSVRPTATTTPW